MSNLMPKADQPRAENPKSNSHIFLLGAILILSLFLRLWNVASTGMQHDAALNSMRALGWFDFLVGVGQSSPLVWLGYIPWWGNLSFHDHPPLAFLIQHIFFRLFGDSTISALLPFALAGVVTALVIYLFLKREIGTRGALVASTVSACSSYSVWSSRSGYLEGVQVLFVTLSFFLCVQFMRTRATRILAWWALVTGLGLLTKYTSLFLIPAALGSLVVWNMSVLKEKKFYQQTLLAWGILIAVVLPVIVYNIHVFQLRGHFDAALSSMLGMYPEDYAVLAYRSIESNFWRNIPRIFTTLRVNMSLPFFVLSMGALIIVCVQALRRERKPLTVALVIHLAMLVVMFSFSGVSDRFLPIVMPFVSVSIALAVMELWQRLKRSRALRASTMSVLVIIGCIELVYAYNTNVLTTPIGQHGRWYAQTRFYNNGFVALDQYLRANAYQTLPRLKRVMRLSSDTQTIAIKDKEVILFDERANWFSRVWYVDRYKYYYQVPLVYFSDLSADSEAHGLGAFEYLRAGGAEGIWIVLAQGAGQATEASEGYGEQLDSLQNELAEASLKPFEIKDYKGDVVFRIYHVQT